MNAGQGCRDGRRRPYEERLERKDRARHELRGKQMKDAKNWPSVA
ncbi:hypothetical protein Q0Z83_059840 [Actinoplanes sichuanensis]|uniref:Transposase n=1 Tax=Actinoplanes sichuanensis TaxID=512349 RepID=A0ABW4A6S9_9ACTN|nr:hypothetical protein [Actinoplanes sichuanensis]BEL07793.1 hypothetical protein Q0Z83_059840 [Actinoplanes sichuanensis]